MTADQWLDYERARMFAHADKLAAQAETDRLARVAEVHRTFDDTIGTAIIRPADPDAGYPAGWIVTLLAVGLALGILLGAATALFPGVM